MEILTFPGRLAATLAFAGALVWLSLLPALGGADDPPLNVMVAKLPALLQKIAHVVCYGVLTFLCAWTVQPAGATQVIAVFVGAVGFGAAMEWLQLRVPTRVGSYRDVLLNALGAAAGLLVAAVVLE